MFRYNLIDLLNTAKMKKSKKGIWIKYSDHLEEIKHFKKLIEKLERKEHANLTKIEDLIRITRK